MEYPSITLYKKRRSKSFLEKPNNWIHVLISSQIHILFFWWSIKTIPNGWFDQSYISISKQCRNGIKYIYLTRSLMHSFDNWKIRKCKYSKIQLFSKIKKIFLKDWTRIGKLKPIRSKGPEMNLANIKTISAFTLDGQKKWISVLYREYKDR